MPRILLDWIPTGGFIAPGVIDNGDGTYRENDIIINPEKYWMNVCRNAPSMFIYDNSYVKCREITLSYTLPKTWLKNVIDGLTVSFVARNPFIVWKIFQTLTRTQLQQYHRYGYGVWFTAFTQELRLQY